MPNNQTLRIGTRGSELAMTQCKTVVDLLATEHPGVDFALVEINSRGDADRSSRLDQMGAGVFTKALEDALLDDRIDVAVHSLKDMPGKIGSEFEIAAVTEREDPREVLINRWNCAFADMPQGARIGTGSPRRTAQMLSQRPDIVISPIRGNVPTRIEKALAGKASGLDGSIMAAAGVNRLGMSGLISEHLDPNVFVPAVGQGSVAMEIRSGDENARGLITAAEDKPARIAATAERAFLRTTEGGCSAPIAAYARAQDGKLVITGFASAPDGSRIIVETLVGSLSTPDDLGNELASLLLSQGASKLIGSW
ncbi:MAG: hydroxymethylbilane synthase [Pirellulaceae bacterium]|jgi:hydroxymethylbilane synthase|nr:hydroxymethylbilane synthase [Pirellulaceae bacterium]